MIDDFGDYIQDSKDKIIRELEKVSTLDNEINRFGIQSLYDV